MVPREATVGGVQGTNAHAILGHGTEACEAALRSSASWRQRRFWHTPVPHQLLQLFLSTSKDTVRMDAALGSLALSHLADYKVC